jgi:hypothetical protein
MLLVLKVAANLTRGWRLGKAASFVPGFGGGSFGAGHQERPLTPAPAAAAPATIMSSDRVRSTVASLETMAATHRIATPMPTTLAMPASVPQLSLAGPNDARGQLRYLHHRVAGGPNNISREMLR